MAVGPVIHFIVVNINGLKYTKGVVEDLAIQTSPSFTTIYDQASDEPGSKSYLSQLAGSFEVVLNEQHIGLNRLWNKHYETSTASYLCFLNNDVRIPANFVADTIAVFEAEPSIGCVIHSTNHPDYRDCGSLHYEVLTSPVIQGWEFTLRREAYTRIPDDLETFGGDDFLFNNLYDKGWKVAVVLSSPIIHYYARSRKYFKGDRHVEAANFRKYGYPKLRYCSYSRRFPILEVE